VKARFAGPARRQAQGIDRWWRANRPSAPDLFARELAEAKARIETTPDAGTLFTDRHGVPIRRVLLPRTSHYVYYEVDREADVATIVAVWGTPRGRPPVL
jgi:plasmid stabilization system protein ParE